MGDMVIVGFRAKAGQDAALLALVRDHVPTLRRLGLATDRPVLAMQASGGVVVEMFEWTQGGIAIAHQHPAVLVMWERFAAVCDYVKLADLPEAQDLFATFVPIEL